MKKIGNLFQVSPHALRLYFVAGVLWLSTIAGFSQMPIFTNAAIAGGNFQFKILIASNTDFTIETSTNLKDWTAVGSMTATNDLITVVDPRGTAGFDRQFYRIALGSVASFQIGFLEFVDAGSFGESSTPDTIFPVTANSYSASFEVDGDTNYPPAMNVFFTGPNGSGLTNSPANPDNSNTNDENSGDNKYRASYQSAYVASPMFAPGGSWMVNYKGSNYVFSVSTPPSAGHVTIPFPSVVVSDDILQSVSWVYRDATTGATLSEVPAYISKIQLQVHGNNVANELYDSDQLSPGTMSSVLTKTVNWSNVSGMSMSYQDSDGNNYVISFDGP